MQFLFNMLNHNKLGQRSLEDVIGIMAKQMRELGHHAIWRPENDQFLDHKSGINVLVEGFVPQSIEVMRQYHAQGARFVILATEEPTPTGFNHGIDAEMRMRQANFPAAAQFCEGILHLVPGEHVTKWYSQFAPSAQADLGYAATLRRTHNVEPDFDFGFYGSGTERRVKILKRLARRMKTPQACFVCADFKTQEQRDREMMRARVIVQIRKFDEMGLVSSSRCNTALHLGRPVIAEPHLLSKPWDEVIRFSRTLDDFYDEAIWMRANWKGAWSTQFERFKTKMSPQYCIGDPLDKIGVLTRKMGVTVPKAVSGSVWDLNLGTASVALERHDEPARDSSGGHHGGEPRPAGLAPVL